MRKIFKNPGRLVAYLVMILLIVVTLFPVYWVLRTSILPKDSIFAAPGSLMPAKFTWDNYGRIFGLFDSATAQKMGGSGIQFDFLKFFTNTVIVSITVCFAQVFFSASGAYAFARLHFPFRKEIFGLYLAALMVPGIVMMIPNFILIHDLGWLNTHIGIVAPSLLMSPFSVFFLRQFFLGISHEVEESAHMDGAGKFLVFFRIILPLSKGPIGTIAIITFINTWSDYMWPMLVGNDEKVRLLTVALGMFRDQTPTSGPDWGGLMAGTTLSILPLLLLFIFMGRKVLNSIGFSGFR